MSSRLVSSIALFVAALATADAGAQGLEWTTDLAGAQRSAAQTNRLVLVHFGGPWCKPCRDMEEQVFARTELGSAIMPFFVPVKVEVQYGEQNELVNRFGVTGFPCDIILTPQGAVVARSTGFKPAPEYLSMLNQAAQTARASQAAASVAVAPAQPPQAPLPAHAAAPVAPLNPPPAGASALPPGANAMNVPPPPAGAGSPLVGMRTIAPPSAAPISPVAPQPVAPQPVAPQPVAPPPSVGARPVAPQPVSQSAPQQPLVPAANASRAGGPQNVIPPAGVSGAAAPAGLVPGAPAVVPPTPPLGAAPSPAPVGRTAAAGTDPNGARAGNQPALPPGSPPLALDGYCPVCLNEKMAWVKGDVRFGAIHRGRTYLFLSATEQAKFLARPDSYSPIMSGNDPVAWLEQGKPVAGKREFGVMVEGVNGHDMMILFASNESKEKFRQDQKRYEFEIKQAMQAVGAGGTIRR